MRKRAGKKRFRIYDFFNKEITLALISIAAILALVFLFSSETFVGKAGEQGCKTITQPGTYIVKPCDVFVGPLGINFRVDKVINDGSVDGGYIDKNGNFLFDGYYSSISRNYAHYGIKLMNKGEYKGAYLGTDKFVKNISLIFTDDPQEVYDYCKEILIQEKYDLDPKECSEVIPTETIPGETIYELNGHFGKTNHPDYPQLAECLARDLNSILLDTEEFFGVPPIIKAPITYAYIFVDKKSQTGSAYHSFSAWYYELTDQEAISDIVNECNEKLKTGKFSKYNHEITHLFITGLPFTLNEGIANFNWDAPGIHWDWGGSMCKEQGFWNGTGYAPYIKYDEDLFKSPEKKKFAYSSGECFWRKIAFDYGIETIPKIIQALRKEPYKGFFKTASAAEYGANLENKLISVGVDTKKYAQWGFKGFKSDIGKISKPSDCGNGIFEPGEECEYWTKTNNLVPSPPPGDAVYLNNMNCNQVTFSDGSVKKFYGGQSLCKNCKFDTSKCGAPLICEPNQWGCADENIKGRCNWDGLTYNYPEKCINGCENGKCLELSELSCGVDIKAGDTFVLDAFDKGVINMKFLGTNYQDYPKARFQNLDSNEILEYSLQEDNWEVVSVVVKLGGYSYRFESKVNDKFDVIHLVKPCNNIFYPEMFLTDGELNKKFDGLFVIGENAPPVDNLALADIFVGMKYRGGPVEIVDATKLDSEIADVSAQNLIVIGNPCVNAISAELLGNPADCTEGLTPGTARIKLIKHPNGNVGLLVDGYTSVDTRLAAKVIAHRPNELSGSRVLIEGGDYATAKLTVVK